MPRSVSSQDGALTVSPAIAAAAKPAQYLLADANNSNLIAENRVINSANSCAKLKHHSSFKGNETKTSPLTTSLQHKRLSDFGIGSSAASSTETNLSTELAHIVPAQSPLVASSTSAVSEIKLSQRPSSISKSCLVDLELNTAYRPCSLVQSGKQQRIVSEQQLLLTKNSSNSGLTVGGTTCQNTRTMPLSPLARQSSSSMSTYEPTIISSYQSGQSSSTTTMATTTTPQACLLPFISTSLIKNLSTEASSTASNLNRAGLVKNENLKEEHKKNIINRNSSILSDTNEKKYIETINVKPQKSISTNR